LGGFCNRIAHNQIQACLPMTNQLYLDDSYHRHHIDARHKEVFRRDEGLLEKDFELITEPQGQRTGKVNRLNAQEVFPASFYQPVSCFPVSPNQWVMYRTRRDL